MQPVDENQLDANDATAVSKILELGFSGITRARIIDENGRVIPLSTDQTGPINEYFYAAKSERKRIDIFAASSDEDAWRISITDENENILVEIIVTGNCFEVNGRYRIREDGFIEINSNKYAKKAFKRDLQIKVSAVTFFKTMIYSKGKNGSIFEIYPVGVAFLDPLYEDLSKITE